LFDLLRGFAGLSIVRLLAGEDSRGPQSGQHGILPIIILFKLAALRKDGWLSIEMGGYSK
jgi:hypothetical protein